MPGALFTDAVRRVSLVADRASPVRLRSAPGSVLIEAQTEGRARAVETVRADFAGDRAGHRVQPALPAGRADRGAGADAGRPASAAAADTAGTGDGDGDSADGHAEPADPGLVSIEFTSPAKPALITRVPAPGRDDGTPGQPPDFRYLVVPLRAVTRP